MDASLMVRKAVRSIRKNGIAATMRYAARIIHPAREASQFDREHGTDTSGIVPLWKLKIESSNRVLGTNYQATGERQLTALVDSLGENLRNFTFIDLGCGKGRTLLVASALGFGKVVGVEFARELVEIARTNIAKTGARNITVLWEDAADFAFPAENLVVYLFNPFSDEILRRAVSNLHESPALHPTYVIYTQPKHMQILDSSGFLERTTSPAEYADALIWKAA